MSLIKVEGQWNGNSEITLNIPQFPHFHSTLSTNFNALMRYPHPMEFFLASLVGTITFYIKTFTNLNKILITNLYIEIEGTYTKKTDKLINILINIHLDSNATPEELTSLQNYLIKENTIYELFNIKKNVTINWN